MRTLSRPMFNMGGPIKQGIMHGIREPHAGGGRAAALVGNPVYPRTGGREHHSYTIPLSIGWTALQRMLGGAALKKVSQKAVGSAGLGEMAKKSLAGAAGTGTKTASGTGITAAAPGFWKSAWQQDPMVRSAKWLYNAIKSPTAKGIGQKVAKTVVSPTGLLGGAWLGSSFLGGDKEDVGPPTGINKPGGFPGAIVKEKKELSDAQKKAFANKQRNERVQKYMDMMGYDRSKKTAIADALIDASKIVGDRGTLDKKNITQELINPIIQATSRRLDKPDQIREAVGLMATKAEIEKDLSKEKDALDTKYKKAQIKAAEAGLEATESFEGGMKAFLTLRKGAVAANELEQMARLLANEHKEPFTKVTEETDVSGLKDGIYMSGSKIIRITGGVSKQIV